MPAPRAGCTRVAIGTCGEVMAAESSDAWNAAARLTASADKPDVHTAWGIDNTGLVDETRLAGRWRRLLGALLKGGLLRQGSWLWSPEPEQLEAG
jgi:hypothetical protein